MALVPAIEHQAATGEALETYSLSVARDIRSAVDAMWKHWTAQPLMWDQDTWSHSFAVHGGSCEFTVTIKADDSR